MEFFDRDQIQQRLLDWYANHGRKHLPWKQPLTPYRVWVAEVMLQQTQVATVLPYYERFIQRFASVEDLAAAALDDVLQLWAGLGYYSRARNLHRTAQIIISDHGGQFPDELTLLRKLPGIGEYTAGAIVSFAFQRQASIVDGNVKRVISRLHALPDWPGQSQTHRLIWDIATHYTPKQQCHLYNQAIMDLGSLVCTPNQPDCSQCPWQIFCIAHQRQQTDCFPVKKPTVAKPTQERYFLLLKNPQQQILLEKRPPTGIWGGLWSLPECSLTQNISHWCKQYYGLSIHQQSPLPTFKHSFSHYHLMIHPIALDVSQTINVIRDGGQTCWYDQAQAITQGIPKPVKYLLEQYQS
ncbi:MAG: A/G-specific adenine glycosylase [Legionellales bacterium]|nr:A/G-specific adenine glycosylase [Legionellales bacterium]